MNGPQITVNELRAVLGYFGRGLNREQLADWYAQAWTVIVNRRLAHTNQGLHKTINTARRRAKVIAAK